jgi:hypothetical protein
VVIAYVGVYQQRAPITVASTSGAQSSAADDQATLGDRHTVRTEPHPDPAGALRASAKDTYPTRSALSVLAGPRDRRSVPDSYQPPSVAWVDPPEAAALHVQPSRGLRLCGLATTPRSPVSRPPTDVWGAKFLAYIRTGGDSSGPVEAVNGENRQLDRAASDYGNPPLIPDADSAQDRRRLAGSYHPTPSSGRLNAILAAKDRNGNAGNSTPSSSPSRFRHVSTSIVRRLTNSSRSSASGPSAPLRWSNCRRRGRSVLCRR